MYSANSQVEKSTIITFNESNVFVPHKRKSK